MAIALSAAVALSLDCGDHQQKDLAYYMSKFQNSRYHATYHLRHTYIGIGDAGAVGTMGMYKDGMTREQIVLMDPEGDSITAGQGFYIDGRETTCLPNIKSFVERQLGLKSSFNMPACFSSAKDAHELLLTKSAELQFEVDQSLGVIGWLSPSVALEEYRLSTNRQILGHNLECFLYNKPSTSSASGITPGISEELCFRADGALLYARRFDEIPQTEDVLEATTVDAKLSDDDFNLPYQEIDLADAINPNP